MNDETRALTFGRRSFLKRAAAAGAVAGATNIAAAEVPAAGADTTTTPGAR